MVNVHRLGFTRLSKEGEDDGDFSLKLGRIFLHYMPIY